MTASASRTTPPDNRAAAPTGPRPPDPQRAHRPRPPVRSPLFPQPRTPETQWRAPGQSWQPWDWREWWEEARGPTAPGRAPWFELGVCFDALRLPAAAGMPLLARTRSAGPALRAGADMWLLVAEGAAEELPGLLRWLEWGTLPHRAGLAALGAGARMPAPDGGAGRTDGGGSPWEAAVWLRPPRPGRDGRLRLPAVSIGRPSAAGAPDLVRLVDAAATECHRALLRRQPLAFS
ncbi:SCO3374 family protein [Streptomyces sp. DSM 42041]|uniref:SCO3374 family protein n=1 Tax=Streptomyces hazeniae TaxID=3075538 RepID=A0ABU2NZ56_9ACTN|nr:SCO3374 family protein [Streptomyces sp. DSM 42041]MDT0381817.1 SCO3374 family protein [Streptomyces sp. DSM 42041]